MNDQKVVEILIISLKMKIDYFLPIKMNIINSKKQIHNLLLSIIFVEKHD